MICLKYDLAKTSPKGPIKAKKSNNCPPEASSKTENNFFIDFPLGFT